jgi:hypothetical protein
VKDTASPVVQEVHTPVCCAHPYYGFVCTPNSAIDFSDKVPSAFGHGATAVIDANGFRNTGLPAAKPADEFWVGLFGGSVAFSVSASDNTHTIAGCLERELSGARMHGSKRVRVVNFALPGGQQPQQLIVFLLNRHLLDAVVTFDGVNEVVVPSCYNAGRIPATFPYRPYYELLFGRLMSNEQICDAVTLEREVARFNGRPAWQQRLLSPFHVRSVRRQRKRIASMDTGSPSPFQSIFSDDLGVEPGLLASSGARHWLDATRLMSALCRAVGVEALFVLQPVPDRGKPLTADERAHLAVYPDIVALRARAYDELLRAVDRLAIEGVPAVSFADVFDGCEQTIYTDLIHFEDEGCRLVASRMAQLVRERWPSVAAAPHQRG